MSSNQPFLFFPLSVRAEWILYRGGSEKIFQSRGGFEPIFSKYIIVFYKFPKFRGGSILRSSPVPPSLLIRIRNIRRKYIGFNSCSQKPNFWVPESLLFFRLLSSPKGRKRKLQKTPLTKQFFYTNKKYHHHGEDNHDRQNKI